MADGEEVSQAEDIPQVIGTSPGDIYTMVQDNTTTAGPPREVTASCDMIDYNYNIPTAIICAMCFVFGIVYTFFGYRFFKAVMFLSGFVFGSVLVYKILLEETALTTAGIAGISLGAGVLLGLVTLLVQYVGLFVTGFHLGITLGMGLLLILEELYHPVTVWIPVGILLVLGIVFALLTLKSQKMGTILGTSIFGGLLMIACLDYFIEKFLIMDYLWDRVKAKYSTELCWYSWVILGCWPFCFLVGSLTQWKITGQGYHHKDVLHRRHREKKVKVQRTRSKDRPVDNTQHSRYRSLYQIRRCNGDVISQNYLQTLQNKLSPSLRNMTPIPTEPQTELESANTTLTQVP